MQPALYPQSIQSSRATEQQSNRATEEQSNRATEQQSNRATEQQSILQQRCHYMTRVM